MQPRQLLKYGFAVLFVLALTILVGWWRVDGPGSQQAGIRQPLPISSMDFRLIDHEGERVSPKSLAGRPTLAFFGFTYCPDVCPTTLADISSWLDALGEESKRLNVTFITVDPERDTVEAMQNYVSNFHPSIRGWTGPSDQIASAAEAFNATYEKVQTGDGYYTMNHTAGVFLFDAEGSFAGTIDYHEPREYAVPKIRRIIGK